MDKRPAIFCATAASSTLRHGFMRPPLGLRARARKALLGCEDGEWEEAFADQMLEAWRILSPDRLTAASAKANGAVMQMTDVASKSDH